MQNEPSTIDIKTLAGKYLTIALAHESYGIAVVKVREIIRFTQITPVPQMPSYVKGVINLRGRVIPVVDMRLKFGLTAETAERTCIVVVEVKLSAGRLVPMGLVVDAVEEVANVVASDIELTPHLGASVDTAYLLGVAKIKGQVKLLLDIDRVVAVDTVDAVVRAA